MGLWPGEEHYNKRYDYSTEYVTILRELWETGTSELQGRVLPDGRLQALAAPAGHVKVVCAGQSPRGIEFGAGYGDYNFVAAKGINTPTAHSATNQAMAEAAGKAGRDVGNYVAVHGDRRRDRRGGHGQVAALQRRRRPRRDGLAGRPGQCRRQCGRQQHGPPDGGCPTGAVNFNMGTLVGSYATVARLLDEGATVPAHQGHHARLRRLHDRPGKVRPAHPAADEVPPSRSCRRWPSLACTACLQARVMIYQLVLRPAVRARATSSPAGIAP